MSLTRHGTHTARRHLSSFHTNPYTGGHIEVRRAHGATLELDRRARAPGHLHGPRQHHPRACRTGPCSAPCSGLWRRGSCSATRPGWPPPSPIDSRGSSRAPSASASARRAPKPSPRRCGCAGRTPAAISSSRSTATTTAAATTPCSTRPRRRSISRTPVGRPSQRIRSCSGIPETTADSIIPIPWNDPAALESALSMYEERVAAVIMVPLDLNNGCITPADGYLEAARRLTEQHGALLVFDEVSPASRPG